MSNFINLIYSVFINDFTFADLELDPRIDQQHITSKKQKNQLYMIAATWESIGTLSSIGYSACAKMVRRLQIFKKKRFKKNHTTKIDNKIEKFFWRSLAH